jgi:hypothetical protein
VNKLKRQLFSSIIASNQLSCLAGDKLRNDIFRWLSPPDPWKIYNVARESRYGDTGAWFVNGNALSEWKASGSSSLLWIHGKRKFPLNAYSFAKAHGLLLL